MVKKKLIFGGLTLKMTNSRYVNILKIFYSKINPGKTENTQLNQCLESLKKNFSKPEEENNWISNAFDEKHFHTIITLSNVIKENLIEFSNQRILRIEFESKRLIIIFGLQTLKTNMTRHVQKRGAGRERVFIVNLY